MVLVITFGTGAWRRCQALLTMSVCFMPLPISSHPAWIVAVVENDVCYCDDRHSPSHLCGTGYRLTVDGFQPAYVDIAARSPISVVVADEPFRIGVDVEFQSRHAFVARTSMSMLSSRVIVV